ncbi:MAG: DNA polymerase III subunit epsilon, partial [Pseudomonadota bacterium]
ALLDSKLLAAVYIELTGGAQAGLDFRREENGQSAWSGNGGRAQARKRPQALPSLITAQERAAHEAFIAELGDDAVWKKSAAT